MTFDQANEVNESGPPEHEQLSALFAARAACEPGGEAPVGSDPLDALPRAGGQAVDGSEARRLSEVRRTPPECRIECPLPLF